MMNGNISRNWSAALGRLGFSSILLYIMLLSELINVDPKSFGDDLSDLGNVFGVLVQTFWFFAVVSVIGGGLLSAGVGLLNYFCSLFDGT